MALSLLSNHSIEQVLLFLFIHRHGYPSLMCTCFQSALTPIQQALIKLEENQIVKSRIERNKRIYSLNENYPLFIELEALLKKIYMLLSPSEKIKYDYTNLKKKQALPHKEKSLAQIFHKLSKTKVLTLKTTSILDNQKKVKEGRAVVIVESHANNQLVFTEKGSWDSDFDSSISFTNTFRWTYQAENELISLEHLRYGLEQPVHLFDLILCKSKKLKSVLAHQCKNDTYMGNLMMTSQGLKLSIRVIGPNKNSWLNYIYE